MARAVAEVDKSQDTMAQQSSTVRAVELRQTKPMAKQHRRAAQQEQDQRQTKEWDNSTV